MATYHIEKVTLIRSKDDGQTQTFSYQTSEFVQDLKIYKSNLKEKYRVNKVHLTYTKIDNNT